uniref:Uncharacterized protein n=1 Tax=Romanomermis culicivorax TaxID=13658 RepID=A0A915J0X8_ROMCU
MLVYITQPWELLWDSWYGAMVAIMERLLYRVQSHFGARLILAPVSHWRPSHFGVRLTLASNVVGAK